MAASTAPSVKASLLALLRADSGLTGVRMDYADPGAEVGQEQLYYGRTLQTEHPGAGMGQRKQTELYEIEVYIGVAQDGDDAQTVEERCWALVARLETVVRANNGPQGALSVALNPAAGWVVMGAIEMVPFADNGQRCAVAVCKVHVEARK